RACTAARAASAARRSLRCAGAGGGTRGGARSRRRRRAAPRRRCTANLRSHVGGGQLPAPAGGGRAAGREDLGGWRPYAGSPTQPPCLQLRARGEEDLGAERGSVGRGRNIRREGRGGCAAKGSCARAARTR